MAENKNETYEPLSFDAIQVGLASPEKIRKWSTRKVDGEPCIVTKAETINYRTLKPERDGLFCEKIFGPSKDWECHCGKYKKVRSEGTVCEKCGVEITRSSVRRERLGRIELASPVSHIWYLNTPNRLALTLDMGAKELESVLYLARYVVLDPGESDLKYKEVIDERTLNEKRQLFGRHAFRVGMGAEAVKELLQKVDVAAEVESLRVEVKTAPEQKRSKLTKRLEVLNAFYTSGNKPEWMILDTIPVIPPDLRPMVQLDGGRFATSDLNDLYRRIINRNIRLSKVLQGAPEIIVRNEKRMLQEAVDALIDNGGKSGGKGAGGRNRRHVVTGPSGRPLKSLTEYLKGKQGRFRQNLLGKRVDYSGRSVIVVGPELKIYQCGLPKEMALELFKPFVMKRLYALEIASNIKSAKKMVDHMDNVVWDVLEEVIHEHPVMLNRAPTLHRLGIQAFEPILVEGKAIKLHPLVCTAFNADFDGDQMAVHLPLSEEAQAECRFLMLSPNNLLKLSDGGPVAVPSQDMVLGIYYLTQERPGAKGEGNAYLDYNEAMLAETNGYLDIHAKIKVRRTGEFKGKPVTDTVETTLGRLIFNEIIPQDLGFVDRSKKANALVPEINKIVSKKDLKKILERVIDNHGATKTAEVLDSIKALGYHYSTKSAITVSVSDMIIPKEKDEIIARTQKTVDQIMKKAKRGALTEEERYKEVIRTWKSAEDELGRYIYPALGEYNNIYMMAVSGARGSESQIRQLVGMRGNMADTTGRTIELPITSSFREGQNVLEYFMSAHGSRKGMSDTALRTADSGYLTRRLVDVAQDIIIREEDCSEGRDIPYMEVAEFRNDGEAIESLKERLVGRFAAEDIVDQETGEVIVHANEMMTPRITSKVLAELEAEGRTSMKIRNNLSCRSHRGVCAKCYGANMATGEPVQIGEAVGIIAAQSIGEPGTQLTMRTFHSGGVANAEDITQGLPRVEELFEARNPKGVATISEIDGVISFRSNKKKEEIVVENRETGEKKAYLKTYGSTLVKRNGVELKEGDFVQAGDKLTEGSVNPHDLLRVKGLRAVQDYMLREVQRPYRSQGVEINDKHIELIVRQMLKKIRVDKAGDSDMLPGTNVDVLYFNDVNERLEAEGKEPALGHPIVQGITKASLATDSFLSAASFQETTKVLTEAAIQGKIDYLAGIKENVLIGNLIPAGTGTREFRDLPLTTDETFKEEMAEKARNEYLATKRRAEERRKERSLALEKARMQAEAEEEEENLEDLMDANYAPEGAEDEGEE